MRVSGTRSGHPVEHDLAYGRECYCLIEWDINYMIISEAEHWESDWLIETLTWPLSSHIHFSLSFCVGYYFSIIFKFQTSTISIYEKCKEDKVRKEKLELDKHMRLD